MAFLDKLFGRKEPVRSTTHVVPRRAVPGSFDDEAFLQAPPLTPARRHLLWLDPRTLNLTINAHTIIHEGNQLVEFQYSEEDVRWAKQVNEFAIKAEQASQTNQFQKAIDLYKTALNLAPGSDLYLMSIGCCYANIGDLRRGLRYLDRAHEISPRQERIARNWEGIRQAAARAGC